MDKSSSTRKAARTLALAGGILGAALVLRRALRAVFASDASALPARRGARSSDAHAPARDVRGSGAFIPGHYVNRNGARDYKLYVPASYQGEALPLVVMLHGCNQNPDDFAAGTRMNAVADEMHCFVVYPAQPASANGARCWNWFEAAHQRRGGGEPSIIAGITRRIIHAYPVDTRRVFVAGLSAGGAMAAVMGATYPDLYAAVGVHSGLPYGVAYDLASALELMQQGTVPLDAGEDGGIPTTKRLPHIVPTIVFHGDRDNRVHPRNSHHLARHCVDAHANTERGRAPNGRDYTLTVYRDTRGRSILEQWHVHDAGHAWSGGSLYGSYTDPKGPDATREMMRFFHAHPRRRGRALLRWTRMLGI